MRVPLKHRFHIYVHFRGGRFAFRVLFGFVVFYVSRKWSYISASSPLISEIAIGWVKPSIQPGESISAWKPYHREYRVTQTEAPKEK